MPSPKDLSFEEKVLLQLSRINFSIESISHAIREPYLFPKQEVGTMDEEFKEQFEKNRKENREEKQLNLQERQLRYTLIIAILSLIISIVGLFIKR